MDHQRLFCKVLNMVPRHQKIVSQILGMTIPGFYFTNRIFRNYDGCLDSKQYLDTINAITQILIVAIMNTLEFLLVPDLLLWGRATRN